MRSAIWYAVKETKKHTDVPDAFFAIDGLFETFLTILGQMDAYPAVIESENKLRGFWVSSLLSLPRDGESCATAIVSLLINIGLNKRQYSY